MNLIHMALRVSRHLASHHSKYSWALTLTAIIFVFGVYFRQDIIDAAASTFTQSSWSGGASGSLALHATDQETWANFASGSNLEIGSTVALRPYNFYFRDDSATTSSATLIPSGGTFGAGTFSNVVVEHVPGTGPALELSRSSIARPMLAPEVFSSYALKSDGTVWSWGDNASGQLGDASVANSLFPVKVHGENDVNFLENITSIAAGRFTGYGIDTLGQVWAWGDNSRGQLGDNGDSGFSTTTPVKVHGLLNSGFLTGIVEVSGDIDNNPPSTALAIKSDGTVYSWGKSEHGELGINIAGNNVWTTVPAQVHGVGNVDFLENVISVASGYRTSYALKSNGTVFSWGSDEVCALGVNCAVANAYPGYASAPVQVVGPNNIGFLENVAGISAGGIMWAMVVKHDGTVWSWGRNDYGQLGDGTLVNKGTPTQVTGLTNVVKVVAGYVSGYALKDDGTVWAWGDNTYGSVGDGTNTQRLTPVQITSLTNITDIGIAGGYIMHALKSDGTVWGWGPNADGAIGDGTNTDSNTPVQVINSDLSPFTLDSPGYSASGTFTSAVIDLGAPVPVDTLNYRAFLKGQTLTINLGAGNTATPDGSWVWINGVLDGGDINALSGKRYFQYVANFSTSDSAVSPTLYDLTINYGTTYPASGSLVSSVYDTQDSTNHIASVSWTETATTTTETIKFQVRTSSDNIVWSNWCGMADTGTTCSGTNYFTYTDNGVDIPATNPIRSGSDDRYVQYKTVLASGGVAVYPLDDDGTLAVDFETGHIPTTDVSGYTTATYTFQSPSDPTNKYALPSSAGFAGSQQISIVGTKIGMELDISTLPAGDLDVATLNAQFLSGGSPVGSAFIGIRSQGGSDTYASSGGFLPRTLSSNIRLGMSVDGTTGEVTLITPEGNIVDLTGAVGATHVVFVFGVSDDGDTAAGQQITMSLIPSGNDMVLTYPTGTYDVGG